MAAAAIVALNTSRPRAGKWGEMTCVLALSLLSFFVRLKPGSQEPLGGYMPSAWGLQAESDPPARSSCWILWALETDFPGHYHPFQPPWVQPLPSPEWGCVSTKPGCHLLVLPDPSGLLAKRDRGLDSPFCCERLVAFLPGGRALLPPSLLNEVSAVPEGFVFI